MKFLIDTNIVIPMEPVGADDMPPNVVQATELARTATQGGHQLFVHPAVTLDLDRDRDTRRRRLRDLQILKYPQLPNAPRVSEQLAAIVGSPEPRSNDWVDNQLLAALEAEAVDILVTEDRSLRAKAKRARLEHRVASITEAIWIVRDLFDVLPQPPSPVQKAPAYLLDVSDPIFESFRVDYDGFDAWLSKCKREHRATWFILAPGENLAGLVIVKPEGGSEAGLGGRALKVCSFKVSEKHYGVRYGELLLKTVFRYATANCYDWLYLTVFPKYRELIRLLEDFGFARTPRDVGTGELQLAKPLTAEKTVIQSADPLQFNIRYGPHALKLVDVPTFVIPIQPRYHRALFPDAELQLALIPSGPPGNAIRKAYVCHSPIRRVAPGALLLFYRSRDRRHVACIGIAEEALLSRSVNEVARYVGKRTVYRYEQIEEMCQRDVLAILFRHARVLQEPIPLAELLERTSLRSPPQSITAISNEPGGWLQSRLAE